MTRTDLSRVERAKDEARNASKPAVVLEIKGGKKVYSTTINP